MLKKSGIITQKSLYEEFSKLKVDTETFEIPEAKLRRAYTWYYVYGQRAMYDTHGFITRTLLQVFYNVASLGGLLFNYPYNDGEGLFNFAKLSANYLTKRGVNFLSSYNVKSSGASLKVACDFTHF